MGVWAIGLRGCALAFVRKEVCAVAAHFGMSVDELVSIDNRLIHWGIFALYKL